MPWKECHVEDARLRFVARLLDGEKMARLSAEFGISRKTGDKIFDRYQDVGLQGLTDRSRRPYRHANQLPLVIEKTIVRLKREYPNWGAPKIRERLKRRCPDVQCPAIRTVHAVLDRHGLVTWRQRRRSRVTGTDCPTLVTPMIYRGDLRSFALLPCLTRCWVVAVSRYFAQTRYNPALRVIRSRQLHQVPIECLVIPRRPDRSRRTNVEATTRTLFAASHTTVLAAASHDSSSRFDNGADALCHHHGAIYSDAA